MWSFFYLNKFSVSPSFHTKAFKGKMNTLILFIICSILKFVNPSIIDCNYCEEVVHNWGVRYTCKAKKLKETNHDDLKITGTHLDSRNNSNVTQFFAKGIDIHQIPKKVGETYKYLEVLRITSCDLKVLYKSDLKNFDNIKYLDLLGNKLDNLESDVFEHTPKLIEIMLNNNRLQFLGPNLLHPLKALKVINFGGNICVSSVYKSDDEIERLKNEIRLKCSNISMYDMLLRFNSLEKKIDDILEKIEKLNGDFVERFEISNELN
jgi:Leucine-rich repeat (LRR) protein